jgi:hypothetical protein
VLKMRFTSAEKTAARQYSPTALHITASPTWVDSASSARESSQRVLELLRRQQSQTCSYGTCGSDCLSQGSFCCNPAGPEFDVPKWICGKTVFPCVNEGKGLTRGGCVQTMERVLRVREGRMGLWIVMSRSIIKPES